MAKAKRINRQMSRLMADVVRTESQLTTLFADNTAGDITAQDGRDLVVSSFGYIGSTDPNGNYDNVDTAGVGAFFDAGSKLLNTTSGGKIWECTSGTPTMATWVQLYPQGSSISISAGSGISVSPSPITGTGTVSANLSSSDVPSLPASKITSGTFTASQIPSLNSIASSSGSLNASNLGSGYPYSNLSGSPSAGASWQPTITTGTATTTPTVIWDVANANGLLVSFLFTNTGVTNNINITSKATDLNHVGSSLTTIQTNLAPTGGGQFGQFIALVTAGGNANGPFSRYQLSVFTNSGTSTWSFQGTTLY